MADAFLHRRSIFDKHKDSYSFKNPIKQMRVSRSWSNPITRHKREKSLHDWANSFAGKRHYRKLSRHNAIHLHEEVGSLGIPAVYSGSTLTLADGSVVTGISPGIRGKCNVTINAVREGDFIRLIPDWDEQGNFFDREVHSKYELDYTNHGTKYDHSIAYLNDLGALAHHEAFHLCEEHMSYDIKDLRDKLCTYLKNEVEKVDLDYDVKALEDSPYPSLAITSKPDDGHYYLEGYLVELKPSDVRFKYQYYGHPHEEVVIVGDDAQDLDVIAKYLFAQVEPKVAEDISLSNQEIVDAIKKADAATQSDERPFVIDIDDKGSRVDVWLKSKETGKDIWNPSWGVVTGVKKIATYDTDENGSADVVSDDPYGCAEDITAFFTKAFNSKAGVKGEAYGGARFGKYDIVQALAKALHNDEDDKYSIRYFDSNKVGIEPGYAYASNKEGEDAWKVLDDGTVEFEFAGKPQGKTKVDSLSELESTILKLFGLQLGSNGEASESLKKNFRFKDPKSDDDLIAIQDIVYEINRRNESQAVAEKIGSELESLMESASRDPKWNEMSDEECASAMYKAAQPILSKITSEQLEEIFRNPGHDHDYFQDAIEYDEEAEEPEYRADDLYDFSSIRHESKCEWLDPEGEAVLKKQAPKLIDALNAEFKRIGSPARLELAGTDVHFSDGYYLPVKCSGKWDEESRMLNARLDGKTLNGVKYYDGNIYLEKGWRPTSFRGARRMSLREKLEKMGSPKHEKADEIVFEPVVNFKPQQYAVYEIDDDGDELECIFSGTLGSAKKKLGDAMGSDPNKKFHVVAIAYTPRGQLADSEVVWSDLKQELAPAANEAVSRVVADNKLGKIVKARQRDNVLAFLPIDDDGKNDDCTYFFKVDGNNIITKGYHWGRDEIDRSMIADDGYPWTAEPNRPTRDWVHTEKYAKQLVDRVRKCLDLGIATHERMGDVSFADLGADPTDTPASHRPLENALSSFERAIWDKYDTDADYIKLRLSIYRKDDKSDKPLCTVQYKAGEEKPWQLRKGSCGALIGSYETTKQLAKDFKKIGEAAEKHEAADEGSYAVYSLDDETGRVSKDGEYPTWRKAYAALADGTVWDEGSSNNFVFHGNHLQQIYKYKKTGRTGKWSGNGYDVIFDREISEDPADYIKAHFTPTRYNACRFNESVEAGITSRDVQAAARSAWSTSGATDFKLDIVRLGDHIIIYAKGPNGEDNVGISWHVHIPSILNSYTTPHVEQFAVDSKGAWPKEPERTFDVKDLDELENQFVDEFKSLQETLDIAKEN